MLLLLLLLIILALEFEFRDLHFKAGALPLEPYRQTFLRWLFWRWGF
jgi:hypothetical protein